MEGISIQSKLPQSGQAGSRHYGMANAWSVFILIAISMTVFAIACSDGPEAQADGTATPHSTPTIQPTAQAVDTPITGAVGSFSDVHDFLQFALLLEQATRDKDANFFLSNAMLTDCSSNPCQAAGPPPQGQVLPVSGYQSESLYLSRSDFEKFLLEFMTNTGQSPDGIGGVEPMLYAYAIPNREAVFEPLRGAEVVEAIITRVSGPPPSDPHVPGLPQTRQTISFGATYSEGEWSIRFIRLLPDALFLDSIRSRLRV
jgi:hypothetical protein